ncbi:hypothetical protein [Actinocrispum wychmicini]|uniref:hypothetical protein n=1 Tax=Actinocrispum wychmicini TaxID=1213861 RepID=UPI0014054948|nr:hypothetical protein [Actinocrispum wychmicini]
MAVRTPPTTAGIARIGVAPRPIPDTPATIIPAGTSQGAGRRSVSSPNTGWATDDNRVAARVIPAAAR